MTPSWEEFEGLMKAKMREVYSEETVEHAMDPRNVGNLENADGFARVTGPCGDTMEVWLRVGNNTITDITYMTDGCGTSIASGSMMTELAKGKDIGEAQKISQQDVLHALGGLPEERQHCALLAVDTLKAAIRNYIEMKREPWKKAYREY